MSLAVICKIFHVRGLNAITTSFFLLFVSSEKPRQGTFRVLAHFWTFQINLMADAGAQLSQVEQFQSLSSDEMLECKVCQRKDISPTTHYRPCLECHGTMHSYCSEPPKSEVEGSLDRYCKLCIQEKGLYKLSENYIEGDEDGDPGKLEGLYFYLSEKIATLTPT